MKDYITSMPSPGFEPSPYGTAVSVTNRYTGWAVTMLNCTRNLILPKAPKPSRYSNDFRRGRYLNSDDAKLY
ncbi:hypothetical protein TNCV_3332051 [Trichonephila clavipes]|nr:hypothetical protein TNCV_3332051 [Trichonephila clavipes]